MPALCIPERGQPKHVAQDFIYKFIPTIDHHKTKYLVEKARDELARHWACGTSELYSFKMRHFVLLLGEYHGEVIFDALQEAILAHEKQISD